VPEVEFPRGLVVEQNMTTGLGMADRPIGEHEFGGASTDLKLSLIEAYLATFTIALRRRYPNLWYIDAFAGTGVRTIKHAAREGDLFSEPSDPRIEDRRGSALIAINTKPAFDQLVFIDLRAKHFRALLALKEEYSDRNVLVLRGNANEIVSNIVHARHWRDTRAVMFLDPYGLQVDWVTLEAIRKTEAIDVWYLVSLEGLFRQAALDRSRIQPECRVRLTRMLGTPEWETDWYEPQRQLDGSLNYRRTASVDDIARYVHRRLQSLFPAVLEPLRLRNKKGGPAFALFFAISNPDPKAIELATRIASHILASGRASQV
jgi:three-Cys-motif partner protein